MPLYLTVLRHAHAIPAEGKGNEADRARLLSPKGRDQAATRRLQMGDPKFDLVLCSPTTRTIETAQIVSGGQQVTVAEELSCYQGEKLDSLFAKLGYASLAEYRKHDDGLMDEIAKGAAKAIAKALAAAEVDIFPDFKVLVLGHAVASNALGINLIEAGMKVMEPPWPVCSYCDDLAKWDLGEAEGFTIRFDEAAITLEIHQ
jgi:broad specificity phosphatase PhoE